MACLAMRFRKIPLAECVRAWVRKIEIFEKFWCFAKMVENHEILDCIRENRVSFNFCGPAGGSALERASPPRVIYMTRRAVLALRVIQAHGKSRSNGPVKKVGSWVGKMKISPNP